MANKKNKNVLLIITFVLTLINVLFNVFFVIMLAGNLFGIVDYYNAIMSTVVTGYDVSAYMTSIYLNAFFTISINIYVLVFYFKGIKYKVNNKQYGRAMVYYGIMQLLFSTYIAGIFSIITAIVMINKKPAPIEEKANAQSYLSDYKLTAMSEAVTRLKELRASGAISEEEYYANLNKILEG